MINTPNKQHGVVLVIALIALAAISLAGVALMRTVDTSNVVSGNIAFNEAAIQMADMGAELAYSFVNGNGQGTANNCAHINAACPSYYYPNVAPLNPTTNLPSPAGGLTWSPLVAVPLPGETTASASYHVQYIIERMCGTVITGVAGDDTANPQVAPTFAKCRVAPVYDTDGIPAVGLGILFYRITVQVKGPKNTRSLAQYFYNMSDTVKK
ncbi:MAG: hypothetical protein R8K48_02450 [Gallionella sp.]